MKKVLFSFGLISLMISCQKGSTNAVENTNDKVINALPDENLSSDNTEIAAISGNSNDIDQRLDEYEKYVNQYIAMHKKAMEGNQLAMNEYPGLKQKAQKLKVSIESSRNTEQITVQQMKRISDINDKIKSVMKKK